MATGVTTYTPSNRLPLQFTGTNSDVWGTILNGAMQRIEDAKDGVLTLDVSTSRTLATANGASDEAHFAILNIATGSGGYLNCPAAEKVYVVNVASAVTGPVTLSAGGETCVVYPGEATLAFCDGLNYARLQGLHDAPLPSTGTDLATRSYVDAAAFSKTNLPALEGNQGAFVKDLDGQNADWALIQQGDVQGLEARLTADETSIAAAAAGLTGVQNDVAAMWMNLAASEAKLLGFDDGFDDAFSDQTGIDAINSFGLASTVVGTANTISNKLLPKLNGVAPLIYIDALNGVYSYNGKFYTTYAALLAAAGAAAPTLTLTAQGLLAPTSSSYDAISIGIPGSYIPVVVGQLYDIPYSAAQYCFSINTTNTAYLSVFVPGNGGAYSIGTPSGGAGTGGSGIAGSAHTLAIAGGSVAGGARDGGTFIAAPGGVNSVPSENSTVSLTIGNQYGGAAAGAVSCYIQKIAVYLILSTSVTQSTVVSASNAFFSTSLSSGPAVLQSAAPVTLTQGAPSKGYLYAIAKLNGAAVLNTDFIGAVSRDGATFSAGSFSPIYNRSDGYSIYRAGPVDLTGQPTGSTPKYKITMTATAEIDLAGVLLREA